MAGGMQTINAMIEIYAYKLVLSMSTCNNNTNSSVRRRKEEDAVRNRSEER
jgi:hypothetical protein